MEHEISRLHLNLHDGLVNHNWQKSGASYFNHKTGITGTFQQIQFRKKAFSIQCIYLQQRVTRYLLRASIEALTMGSYTCCKHGSSTSTSHWHVAKRNGQAGRGLWTPDIYYIQKVKMSPELTPCTVQRP